MLLERLIFVLPTCMSEHKHEVKTPIELSSRNAKL